MKAYLTTSGAIFGAITLAHVLRVMFEGPGIVRDPFFGLMTAAAAGMCFWAVRLLRLVPRAPQ